MSPARLALYDRYIGKLLLFALMLLALLLLTLKQMSGGDENGAFFGAANAGSGQTVYILSSAHSAMLYEKSGSSADAYASKIEALSKYLAGIGYGSEVVGESKVGSLPKDAVLFVVDSPALADETKAALKRFIKRGGSLFFNFTTGFSSREGKYEGDRFVNEITGLKLSPELGFLSFRGDGALFMTPKLLSPLSTYLNDGTSLTLILYDKIPFYLSKGIKPDLYATAFSQATPVVDTQESFRMRPDEAGLGWHGYYGRGRWVYTSFPIYAFSENPEQKEEFKRLFAGIVEFLSRRAVAVKYPYIDMKSAIFISEDTEYKFENFERFADLAKEYRIPVTAFMVASLAQRAEFAPMLERIRRNPYVEFASHSTSHKQIVGRENSYVEQETKGSKDIIDGLSARPIVGFRPPREELDDLMKEYLSEGGFRYILGETRGHLYPKFDREWPSLLYIPRHGTDDYSYLVNLDWSREEILRQIIKEANFVTDMNGIFTLSIHTHLFSYGTNIEILRDFFDYLKRHPGLKPLFGSTLYRKIYLASAVTLKSESDSDRIVLRVVNTNSEPVENLHIKIFKNPDEPLSLKGLYENGVEYSESESVLRIGELKAGEELKAVLVFGREW